MNKEQDDFKKFNEPQKANSSSKRKVDIKVSKKAKLIIAGLLGGLLAFSVVSNWGIIMLLADPVSNYDCYKGDYGFHEDFLSYTCKLQNSSKPLGTSESLKSLTPEEIIEKGDYFCENYKAVKSEEFMNYLKSKKSNGASRDEIIGEGYIGMSASVYLCHREKPENTEPPVA